MAEARVKNVAGVLKEINKEVKAIIKGGEKGVVAAALLIQGESMRLTPVDTGNLRASAYTIWSGGSTSGGRGGIGAGRGQKAKERKADQKAELQQRKAELQSEASYGLKEFKAEVGYTAAYAIFVHENTRGVTFRVGQDHYLSTAIAKNKATIIQLISSKAKGREK